MCATQQYVVALRQHAGAPMITHRRTLLMLESAVTVHSPTTLPMVVVTKPPRTQAGCIRRRLDARVAMMVRVGRSSDLWIILEPPMPSQLGVASGLVQGSVPTHRCAPVPVLHRIPMKPYTHLWLHQLASECDAKYSTLDYHAYMYSHA